MEVISTTVDLCFAPPSIRAGLQHVLPHTERIVREITARHPAINRRLIVVNRCLCCQPLGCDVPKDAIMVSPLLGINPKGYRDRIHLIDVYPPLPGDDGIPIEVKMAVYEERWRKTVERAIREAGL